MAFSRSENNWVTSTDSSNGRCGDLRAHRLARRGEVAGSGPEPWRPTCGCPPAIPCRGWWWTRSPGPARRWWRPSARGGTGRKTHV